MKQPTTQENNQERPPELAGARGSASDYNPAQCLRAEVERFKATNRFTPMEVTGFYIQAAVVLAEHRRMVEALRQLSECNLPDDNCAGLDVANWRIRNIARLALPMSEKQNRPRRLAEARGSASRPPQFIWADCDPDAPMSVRWAFYRSKANQRRNRPDLAAIKLRVSLA